MSTQQPAPPPAVSVTADQVVAGNIARFRRAAGMTQGELGVHLGWSAANVSAAERSADAARERRRFDAQTLTEISLALGIPLVGLFLPPPGDGTDADYGIGAVGKSWTMGDLLARVVAFDSDDDTNQAEAYREAYRNAARMYLSPEWAERIAGYLGGQPVEERAELVAGLREDREAALRTARRLGELADALEAAE